jgi:hypothetical protein
VFVKDAGSSIAVRATEPRPLPLPAPERPLLLKLDDLCLTIAGDGDLGAAQATGAQHGVVFQELVVRPFPPPSGSEGCDHRSETNLCPCAV